METNGHAQSKAQVEDEQRLATNVDDHNNSKQSSSRMVTLRLATESDIPRIAELTTAAFVTGDPVDAYVFPKRKEYPEAYLQSYIRNIRASLTENLTWVVVAEIEIDDGNHEGGDGGTITTTTAVGHHQEAPSQTTLSLVKRKVIAGVAQWNRECESSATKATKAKVQRELKLPCTYDAANFSLPQKAKYKLRSSTPYVLTNALLKNPSVSAVHMYKAFFGPSSSRKILDDSNWKDPDDHWFLLDLCVDPAYQRRGVGKKLVQWGQEHARTENLAAMLCSTPSGFKLYEQCGFKKYGMWDMNFKSEEFADGRVMRLMHWLPPKTAPAEAEVHAGTGAGRHADVDANANANTNSSSSSK